MRYSRGELTREQYRQALVDILKDRYVRGELDVEAYEVDLDACSGNRAPCRGEKLAVRGGREPHCGRTGGAGRGMTRGLGVALSGSPNHMETTR